MNKFSVMFMYLLWTVTIVFILLTTFTNYQYLDLNVLAIFLLIFASLNSFFMASRPKKK